MAAISLSLATKVTHNHNWCNSYPQDSATQLDLPLAVVSQRLGRRSWGYLQHLGGGAVCPLVTIVAGSPWRAPKTAASPWVTCALFGGFTWFPMDICMVFWWVFPWFSHGFSHGFSHSFPMFSSETIRFPHRFVDPATSRPGSHRNMLSAGRFDSATNGAHSLEARNPLRCLLIVDGEKNKG